MSSIIPPDLPPRDPRRDSEVSPTRAGLTGPRAEPARDLRKTVATLRRMNSDAADDSRTSRRYRQLGREATNVNLVEDMSTTSGASPTKPGSRESRVKSKRGSKTFSSPSKHFVPASTYSLISPPHAHHHSAATSTAGASSHASTVISATSTSRTSTATAATTPPASTTTHPPSFGFGIGLGIGVGSGLSRSASNNSISTATHRLLGDDSCTSLTDLILAESENIFGPRELEADGDGPGSRVWEDGEGFWESPCARERKAWGDAGSSVYETPREDQATAGAGAGAAGEGWDSDAENRTPTREGGGRKEGREREREKGREGKREREVLAPKVLISVQPPSEQGTPQSLYDRDGFLR
ncbi:hypothetical protein GTA08_BOTSDO08320 [Neofusicoccum parvum]|uniref:Uncharacterized protein n=1 Tax=Neofusicoccum parvum TaxID=310453 RepID=A0ACB5SB24_9PEZI|nr:hypothetical protein GTA08_BOTSDO08320 [Neofusicoccum parvum]